MSNNIKRAASPKVSISTPKGGASVSSPRGASTTPGKSIIKPIRGDKPALMIRDRLSGLAESFSGFEQEIHKIKEQKKDNDEQQIINIKQELHSIQEDLKSETKKREETVKAVSSMFESEISETRKQVEIEVYKKIDALIESVHHLSNKLEIMEKEHEKDRKEFPMRIEKHSSDLMQQVSQFKARFENDINDRQEKDKIVQKIIEEQSFNVSQMLESERVSREKRTMAMQNDIDLESRMRAKSAKSMREHHKETIDHLKAKLEQIKKEREDSTNEVVKALVHYTAALHDGVKIVSESG